MHKQEKQNEELQELKALRGDVQQLKGYLNYFALRLGQKQDLPMIDIDDVDKWNSYVSAPINSYHSGVRPSMR